MESYLSNSPTVQSGLLHVRKRPGMYGLFSPENVFQFALAYAVDVCRAEHGNGIAVIQDQQHVQIRITSCGLKLKKLNQSLFYPTYPFDYTICGSRFFAVVAGASVFQVTAVNESGQVVRKEFQCGEIMPDQQETGFHSGEVVIDFEADTDLFPGKENSKFFVWYETEKIAALHPDFTVTFNSKKCHNSLKNLVNDGQCTEYAEYRGKHFAVALGHDSTHGFRSFINECETEGGIHAELLLRTLAEEFPLMPLGWFSETVGGAIQIVCEQPSEKFLWTCSGNRGPMLADKKGKLLLVKVQEELRSFLRDPVIRQKMENWKKPKRNQDKKT